MVAQDESATRSDTPRFYRATGIARGTVANVAFADLCRLAEGLGFELRRVIWLYR